MKMDEDERIKDAFIDMLDQSCGSWENGKFKGYDSMYLSTYEHALDLAVELGWIKKEDVTR
jgi:hypothetical protein